MKLKQIEKRNIIELSCLIALIIICVVFLSVKNRVFKESYAIEEPKFKYLSDIEYIKNSSSVGWGQITLDQNLETKYNNGLISLIVNGQQKLFLNCASKDEQEILYRHWKEQEEIFKEKLKEKEQDLEFRQKVYQEVYAFLQYDQYEEEIAFALEEMNKVKGKSSVLQDRDLLPLFCTNLVTNGNLDLEKVREISEKLLPLLEPRQKKLIALVKENNILVTENVKN